jgi:hypothetical protein
VRQLPVANGYLDGLLGSHVFTSASVVRIAILARSCSISRTALPFRSASEEPRIHPPGFRTEFGSGKFPKSNRASIHRDRCHQHQIGRGKSVSTVGSIV